MDNLRLLPASHASQREDCGVILRLARQARGLTQAQAGQLAGYSAATISRFETGDRRLSDIRTLRRLATALDFAPEIFGITRSLPEPPAAARAAFPPRAPSLTTVVTARPQDGDEVRRRELLAGLTGLTGALLLPIPGTPAGPGPDPLAGSLEAILTGRSTPAAPVRLPALRKRLATAWQAFETCHYQALTTQLPGLVSTAAASRDDTASRTRQAYGAILADAYVLASELALKANEDSIAWVTADRALPAARDSGDPAAIAAASRAVAMAMRRLGHYDGATVMLTSTARP